MAKGNKAAAMTISDATAHLEARVNNLAAIYRETLAGEARGDRVIATGLLSHGIQREMGFGEVAAYDLATAVRMLVEATNG